MTKCLQEVLSGFHGSADELIPILQAVQEEQGYLAEDAMRAIARHARVPESRVYAVATFYSQFRFSPIGKRHIQVCRGTACHVRGAPRVIQEIQKLLGIKEDETTPDREYSMETVACIGACGLAPNMVVNKQNHGHLNAKKVSQVLRRAADGGEEDTRTPGSTEANPV